MDRPEECEAQPSASDAALARRAGLGDTASFAVLFERHFAATFRYARHMLDGDEDVAQDAAQAAWVRAWRHLPDFRGEARFQTWLFTIVSREVLDHRRRRRPVLVEDHVLEARILDTGQGDAARQDPQQRLVDRELWQSLELALGELPWRQKACWLLRELEDLSYDEIARILDTTPTVVRGQLHRARRALALRMEQWR